MTFLCLHRTEWWLRVVKQTFVNAGVEDNHQLDSTAWHLIKLYGTTEGWELIPGRYSPLLNYYVQYTVNQRIINIRFLLKQFQS